MRAGRVGEGGASIAESSPVERVYPPSEDLVNLDRDLPTTAEDVRRLRELRATVRWGPDRWAELQAWVDSMPNVQEALRKRKTFEGCEPFEL